MRSHTVLWYRCVRIIQRERNRVGAASKGCAWQAYGLCRLGVANEAPSVIRTLTFTYIRVVELTQMNRNFFPRLIGQCFDRAPITEESAKALYIPPMLDWIPFRYLVQMTH